MENKVRFNIDDHISHVRCLLIQGPFPFAIAGETGIGKSTMMETLFKTKLDGKINALGIHVHQHVHAGCGRNDTGVKYFIRSRSI